MLKRIRGLAPQPYEVFVPNPAYSSAPAVVATTLALSTVIDLTDVTAVSIRPTANMTRYFNTDSTFLVTVPANETSIIVLDETVTEITLTGAATVEIEAM